MEASERMSRSRLHEVSVKNRLSQKTQRLKPKPCDWGSRNRTHQPNSQNKLFVCARPADTQDLDWGGAVPPWIAAGDTGEERETGRETLWTPLRCWQHRPSPAAWSGEGKGRVPFKGRVPSSPAVAGWPRKPSLLPLVGDPVVGTVGAGKSRVPVGLRSGWASSAGRTVASGAGRGQGFPGPATLCHLLFHLTQPSLEWGPRGLGTEWQGQKEHGRPSARSAPQGPRCLAP